MTCMCTAIFWRLSSPLSVVSDFMLDATQADVDHLVGKLRKLWGEEQRQQARWVLLAVERGLR